MEEEAEGREEEKDSTESIKREKCLRWSLESVIEGVAKGERVTAAAGNDFEPLE